MSRSGHADLSGSNRRIRWRGGGRWTANDPFDRKPNSEVGPVPALEGSILNMFEFRGEHNRPLFLDPREWREA